MRSKCWTHLRELVTREKKMNSYDAHFMLNTKGKQVIYRNIDTEQDGDHWSAVVWVRSKSKHWYWLQQRERQRAEHTCNSLGLVASEASAKYLLKRSSKGHVSDIFYGIHTAKIQSLLYLPSAIYKYNFYSLRQLRSLAASKIHLRKIIFLRNVFNH